MTVFHKIALSLGGDLGDTEKYFDFACCKLAEAGVSALVRSSLYRTKPVGCEPGTPDFFNCAVTGLWQGSALELLRVTQKIERDAGRPEIHSSRQARTLDCDLILFDETTLDLPELKIPHPRAKLRRFVLEPLAEIAPFWRFPDGESVADALKKVL